MTQYDSLHQCKSDTGAFELFDLMQPLEDAEELLAILHVESHTVIPHVVCVLISTLVKADLDGGILCRTRKLECVRDEVVQNLPDHGAVSESGGQRLQLDQYVPLSVRRLNLFKDTSRQLFHIHIALF